MLIVNNVVVWVWNILLIPVFYALNPVLVVEVGVLLNLEFLKYILIRALCAVVVV